MNSIQPTKKKIELLTIAKAYLTSQINGLAADLSCGAVEEDEIDQTKFAVGHLVMLHRMTADLLEGLSVLETHANHGLKKSKPSNYDSTESGQDYDAYTMLLLELTDRVKLNVGELPEALKEALRELPSYLRDQISKQEELMAFPSFVFPDPDIISPIPAQRAAINDARYLEVLEVSFLPEYYSRDLKKIRQIVEQKGSFQQIIDLL